MRRYVTPSRRGTHHAGFTLIELLVAFTLLALLLALLAGGLRFGATAWEKGTGRLDAANEVSLIQRFVRRQLSQALPLKPFVERDPSIVAFAGDSDGVTFLGFAPADAAAGGLYQLGLRIEGAHGNRSLVMRWRRFGFEERDFAPWEEAQQSVLMTGIESGAFAYFGVETRPRASAEWRDLWQDAALLPRLVRLRLVFPAGDERRWPALLAAPRADTEIGRR